MELQRDKKELEARMRRETSEAQQVEAEATTRMNIASTMAKRVELAEKNDGIDREMTVLRQEIKIMKIASTSENEPAVQEKIEALDSKLSKLKEEKAKLSQLSRKLEAEAGTHITVYDRQLESRIQQGKTKVAHLKSLMKKELVTANPTAKMTTEKLLAEEEKLEWIVWFPC